ncbi:MAG: ATP-dependent sacrificial sulfur transferase LarE [Elusimicrobia bacterium]|nr:ATP-dependent sacrificial sulfur transferase LarE [Elusimicrobiota bacterium]MBU2615179.1 ATP-dependent sacrificial sulfur transferase LarE [Elusimicrobiota bacterium]
MPTTNKLKSLRDYVSGFKSVVVAYSGGVDSSLVLKVASDTLGKENVIAVVAFSETYPESDKSFAQQIIKKIGVKSITIRTTELNNPKFKKNPKLRCYYCKSELFSKIKQIATAHNIKTILDGSNYDDLSDFRPGRAALTKFKVISPLLENKITKTDVRKISKSLGLPTWNKPQMACLASRIPYGTMITKETLSKIDSAENFLRKKFGFYNIRVRHYNDIARIEVSPEQINLLLNKNARKKIVSAFKKLGYKFITVDLEGFRTGSMNL